MKKLYVRFKDMKKKKVITIGRCTKCPYFQRARIGKELKNVCLGRMELCFLNNDVSYDIPDDCPLEDSGDVKYRFDFITNDCACVKKNF